MVLVVLFVVAQNELGRLVLDAEALASLFEGAALEEDALEQLVALLVGVFALFALVEVL